MLVLSRKKGEQIRIGDDIVIIVQRLSGNRVSIGIEAPSECRIVRGELQDTVNSFQEAPFPSDAKAEAKEPVIVEAKIRMLGENRIVEHLKRTLRSVK